MRKLTYRILVCFLCGLMLLGSIACTGGVSPAESDTATPDSTAAESEETQTAPESETEGETVYMPEDFEVTVEGDAASVVTPMGLAYTVTGYTALDTATATFTEGVTYSFSEEAFSEKFHRFTVTYSATEPVKLWVCYTERGRPTEEYYFLEAGKTTFSGLNTGLLKGYGARKLTGLKVESLTGKACDFTLTGLSTEELDDLPNTYYIENIRFKLGVELNWGGTVSYLEDKSCTIPDLVNLVNKHDTGRLIQQSFYGVQENDEYKPGISFDSKWRYNPVQGGDQYNNPSRLIDLVITENSIYIKAQPQDWSLDGQLTPSYMENTYTLYDDRVQVDNRYTDFSGWEHPYSGQELPAFYTVSYLDTFVWYNGEDSWTGDTLSSRGDLPFWGDHAGQCTFILREKNTETWCAWINGSDDYGLGVYAPNIDQLKAGRYKYDGSKSDMAESTGYVAPINVIKMVSFEPIEYSYLLTAGSTAAIRETFTAYKDFTKNEGLHENYQSSRLPSIDGDITKLDFTEGKNLAMLSNPVSTTVVYDETEGAVKLTAGAMGDVNVTIPYGSAPSPLSASEYKTLKIEYRIPEGNGLASYQSDLFLCAGEISGPDGNARIRVNLIADGEYHTLEVNLAGNTYWKGDIHMIRFDYFDNSAEGDVIYIKSITLE
ncbi:MAG: hypothetical protein IJX72_01125 [Clostridia bacterium]|nr:hypothetical protein [Clostridia bacterium]